MKARIPIDQNDLNSPIIEAEVHVFTQEQGEGIAWFVTPLPGVKWVGEFVLVHFTVEAEGIRVDRVATEDDLRRFRVPDWIQGDETPKCCGKPMFFVGQINDRELCKQPPPNAKLWWHDVAAFYVFTCPYCLAVKAIGQQC